MGGQKRHLRDLDRREWESINAAVVRPRPISLTEREIDEPHNPITVAETPIRVASFIRFYEATIRVEGEAIAWTSRAVKVRFTTKEGARHEVWVWASAVDRRP
jgi:hypothetical protein